MKRKIAVTLILAAFSLPLVIPARALQTHDASQPHARTPEQVVEMYDAKLSLTPEQKQKLKPIVTERQEKMQKLKRDTSLKPADKVRRMKETMKDSDNRINEVLNPDQRTKYAAMEDEMMEHRKDSARTRH